MSSIWLKVCCTLSAVLVERGGGGVCFFVLWFLPFRERWLNYWGASFLGLPSFLLGLTGRELWVWRVGGAGMVTQGRCCWNSHCPAAWRDAMGRGAMGRGWPRLLWPPLVWWVDLKPNSNCGSDSFLDYLVGPQNCKWADFCVFQPLLLINVYLVLLWRTLTTGAAHECFILFLRRLSFFSV